MAEIIDPSVTPDRFPDASAAWDFLGRVTDYEKMQRFGAGRCAWDLGTMRRLLAFLGHPDRSLSILQIGGSKGKGSVARLVEAALRAAGVSTGLYTSPHVDHPLERIALDGSSISAASFTAGMNRLRPALGGAAGDTGSPAPTFFEVFTALAIDAFAAAAVEAAVLEVGLGGPLDATSAVEQTRVSVITTVSRDHTHLLGETAAEIAADKAGILRANVPVVTGVRPGEAAFPPIAAAAHRVGAPLRARGTDFDVLAWRATSAGAVIDLRLGERVLGDLVVSLLGPFQAVNAAIAAAALDALAQTGGPVVPEAALRAAWRSISIPGRMEILGHDPLLVVDGAHNRASALALLSAVRAHFPDRRLALVVAMAGDKLVRETVEPLFGAAERVFATCTDNPRSLTAEEMAALAREFHLPASTHASTAEAIDAALEQADPDTVIVAAGSLYLAGETRAHLAALKQQR